MEGVAIDQLVGRMKEEVVDALGHWREVERLATLWARATEWKQDGQPAFEGFVQGVKKEIEDVLEYCDQVASMSQWGAD